MKKLVFVDSDGTLKNSEGLISKKTVDVLTRLKEKNIGVIITTGRPRYHALKVKETSNASRYVISSNGSEVYDSETDKVIYASYLKDEYVLEIFEIADINNCRCILTVDGVEVVTDIVKNPNQVMLDKPINEYLKTNKVKQIFIRCDTEVEAKNTYKMIKEFGKVKIANESSYFQTGVVEDKGIWFSITNKRVNKGLAIKKLAKYLDVKLSDTYGFGNDYNDIKMFETVNYSIVMENANEDLKRKAKIIAKSNNEDGVADFLEEIFIKGE